MGLVKEVRSVPLFVYELAHRCRVTLEGKGVRKRVAKIVRDTLVSQDANGIVPTVVGDWPFPPECGVEEAPGCILALAALNDFAATHQRLFEKEDCNFTELRPLEENSALEVIAYGWHWMLAVRKLSARHEQTLHRVVQVAEKELGVKTETRASAPDRLIPPEFRTKAISKAKAANLLGKPQRDSGVTWLNQCIADGTISCEYLSRQSHVFDIRQFPKSTHHQLRSN